MRVTWRETECLCVVGVVCVFVTWRDSVFVTWRQNVFVCVTWRESVCLCVVGVVCVCVYCRQCVYVFLLLELCVVYCVYCSCVCVCVCALECVCVCMYCILSMRYTCCVCSMCHEEMEILSLRMCYCFVWYLLRVCFAFRVLILMNILDTHTLRCTSITGFHQGCQEQSVLPTLPSEIQAKKTYVFCVLCEKVVCVCVCLFFVLTPHTTLFFVLTGRGEN